MSGYHRHYLPRRLSMRWFAIRGWPLACAVAFLVCAAFFRPGNLDIPDWVPLASFGVAGLAMGWLSVDPESGYGRLCAVGLSVFTASSRAWAIAVYGTDSVTSGLATSTVWLLIAFLIWALGTVTARLPSRGRQKG